MITNIQQQKAKAFLALHRTPPLLILPNAWDACSVKLFENEGFKAIGTTSAGIASSLGYPDGQRVDRADMMEVISRIVANTHLPVSADIEAGYAISIDGVVASAKAAIDTGSVGINLEDSTGNAGTPLFDQSHQAEKISAIRHMATDLGIHLVINARTDTYLVPGENAETRFRETIQRAHTYRQAGADCIFVPDMGDMDKTTIARLISEINAPVNIIAGENTPPISELERIGVARLSLGPRPMRAILASLRDIARELLDSGTYTKMTSHSLSYAEVNGWFKEPA